MFIFELQVSEEYTPGWLNREVYSVLSSVRKSLFSPSKHFCTTECRELRNKSLPFQGSPPIRSPFSTEKPPRGRVLVSSGPILLSLSPNEKNGTRAVMLTLDKQLGNRRVWAGTTRSLCPCRSQGQVGDEMTPEMRDSACLPSMASHLCYRGVWPEPWGRVLQPYRSFPPHRQPPSPTACSLAASCPLPLQIPSVSANWRTGT